MLESNFLSQTLDLKQTCFDIYTQDNLRLRAAYWQSKRSKTAGTICLFQGRAEFIEKYAEVIFELTARGFAVAAFDWRGQGGSQRLLKNTTKGHVRDFNHYQQDIDAFLQSVSTLKPAGPLYAIAHSMGATILLRSISTKQSYFERAVFSAPMVEIYGFRTPQLAKILAYGLNYVGFGECFVPGGGQKSISAKPFESNLLSSDQARYERTAQTLLDMPELSIGDPTVSWVSGAFNAMSALANPDFGADFTVPSLIISGSGDRLCSTPAAMELANRLRYCKGLEIADARHEILMEKDPIRSQFWTAFDEFIPSNI